MCLPFVAGHVAKDANKLTAYETMRTCLHLNGPRPRYETVQAGDLIREVAQRRIDKDDLAAWLRKKAVD
ncbi:MAG: death-on-curing protein [Sulfitobacter sp.]